MSPQAEHFSRPLHTLLPGPQNHAQAVSGRCSKVWHSVLLVSMQHRGCACTPCCIHALAMQSPHTRLLFELHGSCSLSNAATAHCVHTYAGCPRQSLGETQWRLRSLGWPVCHPAASQAQSLVRIAQYQLHAEGHVGGACSVHAQQHHIVSQPAGGGAWVAACHESLDTEYPQLTVGTACAEHTPYRSQRCLLSNRCRRG